MLRRIEEVDTKGGIPKDRFKELVEFQGSIQSKIEKK